MPLDLTNLQSAIQTRVDLLGPSSDEKTLLLLSKAIEAVAGNVSVSEIIAATAGGVSDLEAKRIDEIQAIVDAAAAKIAQIAATDALKTSGGTLLGWLQTHAGVDASNLGLRLGEAVSGFYRGGAGIVGFVVGGIEVFRTAANGVLHFCRGVTVSVVTLNNVGGVFTPDCSAGVEFDCGVISAASTIGNPTSAPGGGRSQQISIKWTQDASGGRVMSFAANCVLVGGTAVNLGAGKVNFAVGKIYSDGKFYYTLVKGA